jgi:hypothetical protein
MVSRIVPMFALLLGCNPSPSSRPAPIATVAIDPDEPPPIVAVRSQLRVWTSDEEDAALSIVGPRGAARALCAETCEFPAGWWTGAGRYHLRVEQGDRTLTRDFVADGSELQVIVTLSIDESLLLYVTRTDPRLAARVGPDGRVQVANGLPIDLEVWAQSGGVHWEFEPEGRLFSPEERGWDRRWPRLGTSRGWCGTGIHPQVAPARRTTDIGSLHRIDEHLLPPGPYVGIIEAKSPDEPPRGAVHERIAALFRFTVEDEEPRLRFSR